MLYYVATLFLSFATAIPAPSPPSNMSTLSPSVLDNLRLFSQYSSEAYCSLNYLDVPHLTLTCPDTVCPLVQKPSVEMVKSFTKIGMHQTTGLIMLDHTRQLIVIAFRGTTDAVDWSTDLNFVLWDASNICSGCMAHSGFYQSWMGAQDLVLNEWKSLHAQHSTYQTIVTGHSLGGALANLCAANLKNISGDSPISLYTYGSPRVGNRAFASYIEQEFGWNNFRVTHLNDPVPRQPAGWLGFVHPGPEYHITAPDIPDVLFALSSVLSEPANLVVQPKEVLVIPGPESAFGNDGYACTNPAMHGEYIGLIAGCDGINIALYSMCITSILLKESSLNLMCRFRRENLR